MIKCGFKHTFYYFSWIKSTLKPTFYYEKGGDFDFLHILLRLGLFIAAKCVKSQNHPPFYTIKTGQANGFLFTPAPRIIHYFPNINWFD